VEIDCLKEENTRLSHEIESIMAKEDGLTDINQEKSRLNDELDQMVMRLPQAPLLADIIAFLQQSARESTVKLVSVNYKESLPGQAAMDAKSVKPAQSANFQVTASGNHADLISFLTKIENTPRIYSINSGKISLVKWKPMSAIEHKNGSESSIEGETTVIEKESLTYDPNNLVIILDISAFYDEASGGEKIN